VNARHRAREVALQILYRYDMAMQSNGTPIPEGAELAKDLTRHFDHFQVTPNLREFAAQLVAGTLQTRQELDLLIESNVSNWKLNRLGFVDRSLIRMAAYEMKSCPETHVSIIIDEAVELGKQFGNEDTSAFVNGVLDALKTKLRAQDPTSPSNS
jgi:N utilization substance protein B